MFIVRFLPLPGIIFFSSLALSDDTPQLPSVDVYDTQANMPLTAEIGQATSLERADLEDGGKADLNGALRYLGGLTLNQTGQGTTTGITFRGASGGLGLVSLDGVPLFNSFAGFFPLSHFPLDLFDRVSLVRGPGGERLGSRTLGGTIQLQSRRLQDNEAFLHLEGGSYGTLRTNLGAGQQNALGDWTFAAGRGDIFEGISQAGPERGGRERDGFQMTNGLLRWDKDFERGSLDSSFYFVRTREQMDGPGILSNGTVGWKDDPRGVSVTETWVAQTRGRYAVTADWDSLLQIGFTKDRVTGTVGQIGPQRFPLDLTSQLWLGRWENTHRFALNSGPKDVARVVWGVNAQQQHADSLFNNVLSTTTVVSPLVRAETEIGDWLANAEARFDHHDPYGNHTVFTLGGGRRLSRDMLLWVKGGTGYRQPAVNERLHPIFGNPLLKPERSVGGEAGWRWQIADKSEISFSGYYQRYHNLIILQADPRTGASNAANVADANVWGAEAQARHAWNDIWSSGLNYTFLDARNAVTDLKVPVRPSHQGQFWNEFRITQPISVRVELTFRDAYWFDMANTLQAEAAPRLNAQLNYQLTPQWKLYVRGENLNSERSPELNGFGFPGAAVYAGVYASL
ncbi:MAG: TonB-dependent receptor [Methylococcaceae bacterium]|nr:MAG: TonB-dependent receptor [Methylococcaceae bacterium]